MLDVMMYLRAEWLLFQNAMNSQAETVSASTT
jgi:hypothetical protein